MLFESAFVTVDADRADKRSVVGAAAALRCTWRASDRDNIVRYVRSLNLDRFSESLKA